MDSKRILCIDRIKRGGGTLAILATLDDFLGISMVSGGHVGHLGLRFSSLVQLLFHYFIRDEDSIFALATPAASRTGGKGSCKAAVTSDNTWWAAGPYRPKA